MIPLADDHFADEIAELRALGGDVGVSFGGANGLELAQPCASVDALVTQYQAVIDCYRLTRIDFDIEGWAVAEPTSMARRSAAIAVVQERARAQGRPLEISFTLPVLPTGLTPDGINVLRSAIAHGVRIDIVNVMAMDYGDWAAPNPAGRMGDYAIQAGESLRAQLQTLYPESSEAALWRMVGITPMIGVNDVATEVLLSMWSMARDKACPGGARPWADPTCGSIVQRPFEFANTFNAFEPE